MKTLMLLLVALCFSAAAEDLANQFKNPPAEARPWVYWFWNNGNVTKAGITADLEAMQRVGVGGVIIMDVVERFAPPAGTADFMNPEWQDLFCFAVSEAHRLGLKINMTNGPGWCGSSGPWITPALSMQMLVETNLVTAGPGRFHRVLPRAFTGGRNHDGFNSTVNFEDYYEDVAVLAYPVPTNGPVAAKDVRLLTGQMQPDGTLDWEIPEGAWIIQRIGHTTTGSTTRPPVKGGNGLECDKLNAEAMDVHFTNMMGRLISEVGSLAGDTLTATHIDSWEVGSQNWTPKFGAEFKGRRGYDLTPYLPDVIPPAGLPTNWLAAGKVENPVGDSEVSKRFRWDFNETASELLAENYVGRLAQRAHEHGLRLTIEGYNLPFGDEATYTARADEPMTEFWATGALENETKGRQMASVAHIMGDTIVGAEAFTSSDTENWRFHPAVIKALGDFEFSQGVNRFVVHRFAHQPYLDRYPGVTMGPWGLHYERTQTWWNMSTAWHQYLSRCQYLLRQGRFVADLCYLRPQWPNQTYFKASPALPDGYKFDECSAEALIYQMTVENGRLVTKTGMSYRMLVLPEGAEPMTPELARKIRQLVKAGATVLGAPPVASPSLADYPAGDREVQEIAAEVWGDCDGKKVTEHVYGQGRVIWGPPIGDVLRGLSTPPDFASNVKLNWIHRRVGTTDLYFVANPEAGAVEAECSFRVSDRQPELWNPETGEYSRLANFRSNDGSVSVPVRLEGSGSTFVVFQTSSAGLNPVMNLYGDGQPAVVASHAPAFSVQQAVYGVPGDAVRTRDVRSRVEALVKQGENHFQVAQMAEGDDPAFGVVKTLRLEYTVDGRALQTVGQDTDWVTLFELPSAPERRADLRYDAQGHLQLVAREPGRYELVTADGRIDTVVVTDRAVKQELTGPWQVTFPPHWGAPDSITLDTLGSLSESKTAGVKYFSGIATYHQTFRWTPPKGKGRAAYQTTLDLGDLAVMANVWLNGHDLGVVWKAPYRVDITGILRAGKNHLEVRVANLWLNRMIGDAGLPVEKRLTWSTYEPFKKDEPLPKSGLLGPVTIQTLPSVPVP